MQAWLQVLGGAGPAIAAVPLTVVWVGGSFVSLLTGIGAGKVGPVDAAQRVGYVFFMSVAQVSNTPILALLILDARRMHRSQPWDGNGLLSNFATCMSFYSTRQAIYCNFCRSVP